MIKITVQLSEGIRSILRQKGSVVAVESEKPLTIEQLARHIGIPSILIAFAIVDGEKKNLEYVVTGDSSIHLFGTMSGG